VIYRAATDRFMRASECYAAADAILALLEGGRADG
jgi:hypothetical protein